MPTKKKRINVTLGRDTAIYLKQIALRDDVPEATKASQLIDMALEIEEDLYFSRIGDEKIKNMKGTISHKEFWSKVHKAS